MTHAKRVHSFAYLKIENEIVQLHQFFQDWFNGDIEPSEGQFARLDDVLAENFSMIAPNGNIIEREPLLERLRLAHNSRQGMRIWIENVRILRWFDTMALATYEEWQEIQGQVTSRLSSVLFQEVEHTPNGWQWLHVHETWMDDISNDK
jgi:hypothetical protein